MSLRPPPRDFYFSIAEAVETYFSVPLGGGTIIEYRREEGTLIWATEVTEPGASPVSMSPDLQLVARSQRAEYVKRRAAIRAKAAAAIHGRAEAPRWY